MNVVWCEDLKCAKCSAIEYEAFKASVSEETALAAFSIIAPTITIRDGGVLRKLHGYPIVHAGVRFDRAINAWAQSRRGPQTCQSPYAAVSVGK